MAETATHTPSMKQQTTMLPGFNAGVTSFMKFTEMIRGEAEAKTSAPAPDFSRAHESWLPNWMSLHNVSWDDPICDSGLHLKPDRLFYLVPADAETPIIASYDAPFMFDTDALYQFFSNFNEFVNAPEGRYDWSGDRECLAYNRFLYLLYGLLRYRIGNRSLHSQQDRQIMLLIAHYLGSLEVPRGIREGCGMTKRVIEAFGKVGHFMDHLVSGSAVAPSIPAFEEFLRETFIPLAIAFNAAYIHQFDEIEAANETPVLYLSPFSMVDTKPAPEWGCDESTYLERKKESEETFPMAQEPPRKKAFDSPRSKPFTWDETRAMNQYIERSKTTKPVINERFAAIVDEERRSAAAAAAAAACQAAVERPNHPEVINRKAAALMRIFTDSSPSPSPSPTSSAFGAGSESMSDGTESVASASAASTAMQKPKRIPNILRRRPTNPNEPGSSLYLFHYGDEKESIYHRPVITIRAKGGYKPYTVMKVVNELPDLLRKPRNKANFMTASTNKFFERPVSEMEQRYKNQLYFTMIDFCEEIAQSQLMDNDARMEIMSRYYGARREDEPLDNYYHNFRKDVWNSIAMFYAFYSYL